MIVFYFFFSSRRRHTRCLSDWSSDVCSSDLIDLAAGDWTIELQTLMGAPECFLRLRTEGGYGLTHIGSLQKRDGAAFSGQEIGRASCRERVEVTEGGGAMKRK